MISDKQSQTQTEKIHIAIVGCGRISKNHIMAIINDYERCDLVAICDTEKNKLDNAEEIYLKEGFTKNINMKKVYKFESYKELLDAHLSKQIK